MASVDVPAEVTSHGNTRLRAGGGRDTAFRAVGITLGLLLLTAAFLKFRDLTWEPFGKAILIPPRLRVVFVEMEVLLGLWLLTGLARRALWIVAISFFSILAIVSGYLALTGEPTCGCFGQAAISPWITFGIDAAAIVLLAATRPRLKVAPAESSGNGRAILAWAGVAVIAVTLVQVGQEGGLSAAWQELTGQSLVVEPTMTEIGSGRLGDKARFVVTLRNVSGRDIQVIGGTNNCVANAVENLPVAVPAGEFRRVEVVGYFKGSPGNLVREFGFVTNQSIAPTAIGRFAGTLVPND